MTAPASVVLEFVVCSTPENVKDISFGESRFMIASTRTTMEECVHWVSSHLAPKGAKGHEVRMLLGDFGVRDFVWKKEKDRRPRVIGDDGAVIADFFCHNRPIMVRYRPFLNPQQDLIIKRLSGKTLEIKVWPGMRISQIKTLIHETGSDDSSTEFIHPPDLQRLIYKGKQLEDHRTLSDYNIPAGDMIHLVIKLRGGGRSKIFPDIPGGRGFVDVTCTDAIRVLPWNETGPTWRFAMEGLCLEGRCVNIACPAYKKMVVVNMGFGDFNLFSRRTRDACACPVCQQSVLPLLPAFNNCRWKISAVKTNSPEAIFHKAWTIAGDAYTTFDKGIAGRSVFEHLQIFVRRLTQETPTTSKLAIEQTICTTCFEPLDGDSTDFVEHPSGCGHCFHEACHQQWSDLQKSMGSPLTCPICRSQPPVQQQTCGICTMPLSVGGSFMVEHQSGCGHLFHEVCANRRNRIQQFLGYPLYCPVCRSGPQDLQTSGTESS